MASRDMVSFRMGPSTVSWIETMAASYGVTKTQVVRAIFAVALGDELPRKRIEARLEALGRAQDQVEAGGL